VQYSQVIAQMRSRADRLLRGNLDELVKDYVFPFPVDLMSTRMVVQTPEEGRALLELQRSTLLDRGVTSLQPDVTAVDLPRTGRVRVWVDWHEVGPAQEVMRVSTAIYYCSVHAGALKIEMINYTRLSMPELKPQFAALALTA
jgi:hypothetical protein